jgi:PAS domain S-box-containing protein
MSEANSEFLKGRRERWTILPTQLLHYGVALLCVALAVGTNLLFNPYIAPTLTPPFFAAVMVSAWYGGLGPGLLATVLSTLAINYFWVEPLYSLNIPSVGSLARLGVFVMAAILINSLNQAQRVAQRRAEANLQSLRESEARFGRLAESNIIGIIVADLNGPILEANAIFLKMVGYTQEELRSGRLRWREMTPAESLEVSERAVQELTTTGVCTPFEKEYIRKDGSRVPVLHGAAMTGETTLIGFVLDLSERKRDEADRKRAQETLERTNQTLQTLIDVCPVAIALFDPQGIVKLWNRAAEQIFGWSTDEAIGQFMPTVPHRPQEFLASIQRVLSGRSLDGLEAQHQRKDGQIIDLEIWANLTYDAQGNPGCLGIAWDITQRKQAQAALRQSEARFQVLVSNLPGMVYRYALCADGADAFTYVSSGSRELLELEPETILQDANSFLALIHPDDLSSFEDSVAVALENSLPWQWEGRLITPSGQLKWIQARSRPEQSEYAEAWDGLFLDITDRKQAELEIRKFVSLADNSTEFIGMCDMNGVPFYVNAAGRQMVGLDDVRRFNETPVREFFFPEDRDFIVNEFFPDVLRQGRAEVEIRFRHFKTGEALWMIYNVFYIRGENDQPIGLATVSRNITDRKRVEAERERLLVREQAAREQAEAANRIKDEFLAVLSHELRSPLNPILGWAKLLRSRKLDEQKMAQALETIERNASLQTQLIGDLLDVSRILQGKLSLNIAPVDLATTIAAAMETVRLAADAKSIQIQTALNEGIGKVSGDSGRLQQIIWNLLANAVKFTPEGGRVEVRLERVGTVAQITVSDTGKGISPDFLPFVFDYFRQADGATTRKFGGLGLGLAIVRHLTELHGGTVTAQSLGEGQGATFIVRLPLLKEAAGLENQPSPNCSTDELATSPLAGLSILVVDDDADTREYLSFVLEQAGATVICAASADEALQVLVQSTPDLLLSDIGMPEMDGYMLMRRVRAMPSDRGGQIRAIALTAYAGEMNQQQAIAAGFQEHLSKPVDPEYLIQAICSLSAANTALLRHP